MNSLDLYYHLRPFIPRRLQISVRRCIARRKRLTVGHCWPILETAGTPPPGWQGWPDGKQFALVLTHDVETQVGHDNCRALMALEEHLGFHSSFNIIPERYQVSADLRQEMAARGFEVGVHGLYHDGRLFKSRRTFEKRLPQINRYLKEWNAIGFRSPSMLRNLQWISEFDIEYDLSTFDTDPFEPQSEGVGTIFPFILKGRPDRKHYIEIPYTLPQDSTLFIILDETSPRIWKEKLAWIAEKGGVALINTHPDYTRIDGDPATNLTYPVSHYREFLEHVATEYRNQFWHALPRDLARFWSGRFDHGNKSPQCCLDHDASRAQRSANAVHRSEIWIDLDNTPHVPFFKPIIRELGKRGIEVVTTARDAYQVCDVAEHMKVPCIRVGHHYGRNKVAKLYGTFYRAIQLCRVVRRERPLLAISHGSRSQLVLSKLLRIPTVLIADYEHSTSLPIFQPSWLIVPEVIRETAHEFPNERILHYPGIKEDVYAPDFVPDPVMLTELGIDPERQILVTVRPPATEAHYHNPESEPLFFESMRMLNANPDVIVVLLPRNERQTQWCRKELPDCFASGRVIIPDHALDGLNLIWHSDFVISGGGTMNREAAALGIPVYSIFRGTIGAVDKNLSESGRLVLIESMEDVHTKIAVERRRKDDASTLRHSRKTIEVLIGQIVDILDKSRNSRG